MISRRDSQNVPRGAGLALPFLQLFRLPSEPEVLWKLADFVFLGVDGPKQSRSAQISTQKQKAENKRERMRLLYVFSNFWPNKPSQARIGKFVSGRTQRVIPPTLVHPVRVRSYPRPVWWAYVVTLVCLHHPRQYVWVIHQVWGQDDWTLPKFSAINTQKKKQSQFPAILPEQNCSLKDLSCGLRGIFLADAAGSPERAR